jgi:hypothetical protein
MFFFSAEILRAYKSLYCLIIKNVRLVNFTHCGVTKYACYIVNLQEITGL